MTRLIQLCVRWSALTLCLAACAPAEEDGAPPLDVDPTQEPAGSGGAHSDPGVVGGATGGTTAQPEEDAAPCGEPVAFTTAGASVVYPTPARLAQVLGTLLYAPDAHPLTVVLLPWGEGTSVVVSRTLVDEGGLGWFPEGQVPPPVAASLDGASFESQAVQPRAWLALTDDVASLVLPLENLSVSATTRDGCSAMAASVVATLPEAALSTSLTVEGQVTTLSELVDQADSEKPSVGVEIKLLLGGPSTDFDFEGYGY